MSVELQADYETNHLRANCALSHGVGDIHRIVSLLECIDLLLGALVRQEHVTTGDLGISEDDPGPCKPQPQTWDEVNWTPSELNMRKFTAKISGNSAADISKGAPFFSLGIDSITAVQFTQRLRQSGPECSSADIMRYPCMEALAQDVCTCPNRTDGAENCADQPQQAWVMELLPKIPTLIPRNTVKQVYPCTPLQSSMLTQTLGSDSRLYVHYHAVSLSHHLDLARLKQAWGLLTAMTEILRTTFRFCSATSLWLAAVHQETHEAWTERHGYRNTFYSH